MLLSMAFLFSPSLSLQASVRPSGAVIAAAAADTLCRYTHVRETRPNRGVIVDQINASVGNPAGSYWCMATVYWAWQKVCSFFKVENKLPRTGRVATMLRNANRIGSGFEVIDMKRIGANNITARKGDIGAIKAGSAVSADIGRDWSGHVVIITHDAGSRVADIEGNTNRAGSRNGDRIALKMRKKSEFIALVRAL